jgi:hypothetical protein
MANFPTTLDTFVDPIGTDLLENTNDLLDHHAQHNKINDVVRAVEGRVGINTSPAVGSMEWTLQNGIYRPSDLPTGSKRVLSNGLLYNSTDFSQDDEFNGTSLGGQWSVINSGRTVVETITLNKSWFELSLPAIGSAVDRNRFIVQNITNPTAGWFFGAKIAYMPDHRDAGSFRHSGIFLRASSTGKYLSWGLNFRGSALCTLGAWAWNSPDTAFASFRTDAMPWGIYYVGITRHTDGFYWYLTSDDGIAWTVVDAYVVGTHVPDADQIGVGLMSYNTTQTAKVAVDWIRRFA